MSIHPEGKSRSDVGRVLVLNDPREWSQNILTKMTGMQVSQHRHKRHTLVAALERGGRQGLHDAVFGSAKAAGAGDSDPVGF